MQRTTKVVLVETNNSVRDKIKALLEKEMDMKVIFETKSGNIAIETVRNFIPDVLILSSRCEEKSAYEVTQILNAEMPNLITIIVGDTCTADDLKRAMKAGARDHISYSEIGSHLVKSIREFVDIINTYSKTEKSRDGKVISFISSKGAAGKSTIVTNVATSLAQIFVERNERKKILIIDYDLQFGDIAFLTNIRPEKTLEVLADIDHIDIDMIESIVYDNKEYGVSILPAPSRPEYESRISLNVLADLINIVRTQFDFILIDAIQGFQNATIATVQNSDLICVVAPPDLYSIKNALLTFETLDMMDIDSSKVKYILNKYERKHLKPYEISGKTKREIFHIIPYDRDTTSDASELGEPIVIVYPKTALAKEYRNLATKFLQHFYPEQYKSGEGFLGKLFK